MNTGSWRLALRLARRDALRSKGRSMLVVALVGLPILILAVMDIGYRTYQLDPAEKLTRAIGSADVGVQWSGLTTAQQGYQGWLGDSGGQGSGDDPAPSTAQVRAALPAGSRVIAWRVGTDPLTFRTRSGLAQATFTGLDVADVLTRGIVHQASGRAPRSSGEVALTPALAAATGLHIGDRLRAVDPSRVLAVVGIVRDGNNRTTRAVFGLPSAVPVDPALVSTFTGRLGWLAATPRPVTWPDVTRLNGAGLLAVSRAVYLHPSAAALAATERVSGSSSSTYVAPLLLIAGMALFEVVLLAGPAFAVSAKRCRRDLALIAAVGGSPRQLRRVVLCSGVVLGLGAGVFGLLGALAVASVGEPLVEPHVASLPGHFDVRPVELLALLAVGLVAALAAAVAPARAAARADVVAVLSGRRGDAAPRPRLSILGVVLAGLGTAVALSAAAGSSSTTVILAGIALVEVGLVACTPALLSICARLGRRLPLPTRLALRDAGRNRSAAAPAVAAVMAAVIGAVALIIGVSTQEGRDRREYTPQLPAHTALVSVTDASARAVEAVTAGLRATLPTTAVGAVRGLRTTCPAGGATCTLRSVQPARPADSPVRFGGHLPEVIVADASQVGLLFGTARPEISRALAAGQVVVADPGLVRGGHVGLTLATLRPTRGITAGSDQPTVGRPFRAPALAVSAAPAGFIVTPLFAARYRLSVSDAAVLARTTRTPTDAQQQAATARAREVVGGASVIIERGYRSPYGTLKLALVLAAVLIAVVAAVVATGLANVDGQTDLATLGAVGASPRVRRRLSGARAAVIAVIGTVVGTVAGFVVPAAWVLQIHRADAADGVGSPSSLRLQVPWVALLVLLVTIPVIAAALAALLSRSRLPGGAHG